MYLFNTEIETGREGIQLGGMGEGEAASCGAGSLLQGLIPHDGQDHHDLS